MIVALSGGIGGAKLALGLSHVLPPGELLIVANTGDDFEHLGLSISPDIDTLTYALAGLDNTELGWGRRDETWSFMETLGALGGETWFRLGDRDLALHVERTRRLRAGETLSAVTADVAQRLGVRPRILPMSDDPVRTRIRGEEGWIDFQDWFVRQQCRPAFHGLEFAGAAEARPRRRLQLGHQELASHPIETTKARHGAGLPDVGELEVRCAEEPSRPSGTHRPTRQPAAPRGWPTPPATDHAACHRPRTRSAPRFRS